MDAEFEAVLLGVSELEGEAPISRLQIHERSSEHSSTVSSELK
jgi:hypothetical protein